VWDSERPLERAELSGMLFGKLWLTESSRLFFGEPTDLLSVASSVC